MKYIAVVALYVFTRCLFASPVPIEGFPSEFSRQILAENMIVDGRESQVFQFRSNRDLGFTLSLLKDWLSQPRIGPQVSRKDGWIYVSQRRSGWWVIAQVRELHEGTHIEGLLIFWKEQGRKNDELTFSRAATNSLSALQRARVIRQVQSVDENRRTLTLTISSKLSLNQLHAAFEKDFRRMGLNPASFSPLAAMSMASGHITQVWVGKNTQISITLFEHRGDSAAVLHWMGFNSKESAAS
jgi:hypothetical protein